MKQIAMCVLVFIGICVFGSSRIAAQDISSRPEDAAGTSDRAIADYQMARLSNNIRSFTKQIVAANLTFTDNEAAKFWPVYEQYSQDLGKINEARIALIEEYAYGYGMLTDEEADRLIGRWLDADISAAQLRQKYVPIFRRVLPGKKAATFFQLDRRISMMIDVELTSHLPLVQSQDEDGGEKNEEKL